MNATGLDPKNIYYIGFSIGAQSLALAAKTIRPRIGKMLGTVSPALNLSKCFCSAKNKSYFSHGKFQFTFFSNWSSRKLLQFITGYGEAERRRCGFRSSNTLHGRRTWCPLRRSGDCDVLRERRLYTAKLHQLYR